MPKTKKENDVIPVHITKKLRPAYYDDFKCFAGDCKVTCCQGWSITFDRKDYLKLRGVNCSEELKDKLKYSVRRIKNPDMEKRYAEMHLKDSYCCMFTEDGLCALQMECGYNILPEVCKLFPRKKSYLLSGYIEDSLSPACEAVLELLWNLPDGIDFISEDIPKQQHILINIESSSPKVYLNEIRSLCIDILQDRRFSINQRILLMGMFFQKFPDDAQDIPKWINETNAILSDNNIVEIASKLSSITTESNVNVFFVQNFHTFLTLSPKEDILKKYGNYIVNSYVQNVKLNLDNVKIKTTFDFGKYKETYEKYKKEFGDREYFFENLFVAVFFHLNFPFLNTKEDLWKSYVDFCNICSIYKFISIMSCTFEEEDMKQKLFEGLILISRSILHSHERENMLTDELFENESSSLAHMAVLLCQ